MPYGFYAIIILLIILLVRSKKKDKMIAEQKKLEAERKAEEDAKKEQERKAAIEAEKIRKEEAQRIFDETHGKIFTKVAGVSFYQSALKALYKVDAFWDAEVEITDYEGEPAIAIMCDDQRIGSIPRAKKDEVLAIAEKITALSVTIEEYENDEEKKVYRADLLIIYEK